MKASELIALVRHELAEPVEKEWKTAELMSYLNHAVSTIWRRCMERHSPLVETTETVNFLAGVKTALMAQVPLRMVKVATADDVELVPSLPRNMKIVGDGTPQVYALSGLKSLEVWPTPSAATALTVRYVPEAPFLVLNETVDSNSPFPEAFDDMLVQFVLVRAYNRVEAKAIVEQNFYETFGRELDRLLEERMPILLTGYGPWVV